MPCFVVLEKKVAVAVDSTFAADEMAEGIAWMISAEEFQNVVAQDPIRKNIYITFCICHKMFIIKEKGHILDRLP